MHLKEKKQDEGCSPSAMHPVIDTYSPAFGEFDIEPSGLSLSPNHFVASPSPLIEPEELLDPEVAYETEQGQRHHDSKELSAACEDLLRSMRVAMHAQEESEEALMKLLLCRGLGGASASGGRSNEANLSSVDHAAVKSALECELGAVSERATLWGTVLGM